MSIFHSWEWEEKVKKMIDRNAISTADALSIENGDEVRIVVFGYFLPIPGGPLYLMDGKRVPNSQLMQFVGEVEDPDTKLTHRIDVNFTMDVILTKKQLIWEDNGVTVGICPN